jgi:hypothetical protein
MDQRRLLRRVIDIRANPPKLYCDDNKPCDFYTALDYCWGEEEQEAKLTTKRISEYIEGLPLKDLPQTLQDAIEVTKNLNIPYLWIDSLL